MKNYTTSQIAKIINVHPNTVILYEKWGHIEEVKRKPNGYRIYTEKHLEQMKLARMLLKGEIIKLEFRMRSLDIIKAVVDGNFNLALSKAKAYLLFIKSEVQKDSVSIEKALENLKYYKLDNLKDKLKTNEIAKIIGVNNDVLIYWERNGLLNIARNKSNNYREYSKNDLIMAGFIKVLRESNYTVSGIYRIINKIELSNNKTLSECIYDLDLNCEIVNDYNKLLEPLNEIEVKILGVIEEIDKLIKRDEEG